MKCLIVIPSLMRAGAETQAVDLANGLASRGHLIHLCSFESQLEQRNRLVPGVKFHHVRRKSKYDLSLISRLAAIIDAEGIEIVQGVLAFGTLVGWLSASRSKSQPPVVAAIHTTIHRDQKEELFNRLIYRPILRRVAAVIFVCQHQFDYWTTKYPELEKLAAVVHNGVAAERFKREDFVGSARELREVLDIPKEAFVLASIAAFRPEKGHKLLIEAFARAPEHTVLIFAGDGAGRPAIEDYVAAMGLSARTRFLGNVPDTRPLIAASQATVLASTAVETFSMAMLESMAMGVPMIAPRIGGLPEAIIDDETGLLFQIGDISALADCIQRVAECPQEAVRLGALAQRKVMREFTLDEMVAGTEKLLSAVIEGKWGGRPSMEMS